ncbi:ATP-binding cassette sub-family A member 1-like [Paramuricea clavata]|nr:ATP-binding cassette sub-family A member 1-like [Paramuricea clavata]
MFRACLLDNIGSRVSAPGSKSFFLQLMKTYMSAKILYTPDNPHTRTIIEKANFTFSEMGYVWERIRLAAKNGYFQVPQIDSLDMSLLQLFASAYGIELNGLGSTSNNVQMLGRLIAENGDCLSFDYFKPVEDERAAEKIVLSEKGYAPLASVVFTNVPDDAGEIPAHVEYKIRQEIDTVQNPRWQRHRYWRPGPENSMWRLRYKFFGFIFLQDMIDRGITEVHANETIETTGMFLQMFPYPCYIFDRFSYTISNSMPLFMTLAWIYSVGMIIKTIVHEKETRLKEVMKVMGLTNSVHWLAWFITSVVMMMITTVLLVAVLKFGDILQYSDPTVIFVFFFVFTITTIMFCFLISVFFSRANVAAACGGLIYLTTYLPYVILTIFEENVQKPHLIASCLLSPTAFGIACRYFARFEEQGIGLQWSNLYTSPVYGDEFNVGGAMFMLIVDAIIYGLLTWYIEAVFPGQYGVPKPWYFPFMRSYWCSSRTKRIHGNHDTQVYRVLGEQGVELEQVDSPATPTDANVAIEREPRHLPLGISMRNLKKVYSNGKVAVDDLSLNLYSGQITSFLGHNGAGKTTTMSLLTGIYPPTAGTAFIEGNDIRSNMDEIRSSLGMCPQYNVLFDDLTVEEHLWFYAKLKGMDSELIPDEIEKFLANSQLIPKRKERSKFLSGGMKRKLSVSMAFVAGSKTVILDEPTAGVDPYARRAIWDLLLQYKPGRTILLSTHHMDEADVLGDRIAIIAQGKLCCCGTSLFLKSQYGSGYYLTLVKKDLVSHVRTRALEGESDPPRRDSDDDQSETSSRSIDEGVSLGDSSSEIGELSTDYDKPSQLSLTAFIKSYVAQAEMVESVGTEVTYVLPTGESYGGKFENLFEALSQNLERFNISSFGVSDTTLEEVFLKVASAASIEEEEEVKSSYPTRRVSVRNEKSKFERFKLMFQKKQRSVGMESVEDMNEASGEVMIEEDEEVEDDIDDVFRAPRIQPKATGLTLIKKQFIGLLRKRLSHAKRNRKGFISQIVLPALFVCLAMISAMLRPPVGLLPSLKLTTTDAIPQPNNMFFADARKSPSGKRLADTFVNPPGVGSHCISLKCSQERLHFGKGYATVPRSSRYLQSCSCKTGAAECSDKCCKYPPPHAPSDTGDTVFNITLRDYDDYLLRTTKEFRKRR